MKRAYITDYLDKNGRTVLVARPSVKVSFSKCKEATYYISSCPKYSINLHTNFSSQMKVKLSFPMQL